MHGTRIVDGTIEPLVAAVFVAVAVAAWAKVGSGAPDARAATQELSAALITLADLPSGWSVSDEGLRSIEADLAGDLCGTRGAPVYPEAAAAVVFAEVAGDARQLVHVVLRLDPADTAPAMRCLRAGLTDDSPDVDGTDRDSGVVYVPIPVDDLGDESFGYRAQIEAGGQPAGVLFDAAVVRRANLLSIFLIVSTSGYLSRRELPAPDVALLVDLARIADRRLAPLAGGKGGG